MKTRGFLLLLWVGLSLSLVTPALSAVRLAVLTDEHHSAFSDELTAHLSTIPQIEMVDRQSAQVRFHELERSLSGFQSTDQLLQEIATLRADLFLIIQEQGDSKNPHLMARLISLRDEGIREQILAPLAQKAGAQPWKLKGASKEFLQAITDAVSREIKRQAGSSNPPIRISLPGLTTDELASAVAPLAAELSAGVRGLLALSPDVIVLERQNLELLAWEQMTTRGEVSAPKPAEVLVSGRVIPDLADPKKIRVVMQVNDSRLEFTGQRDDTPELVRQIAAGILTAIKRSPAAGMNPAAEAERLYGTARQAAAVQADWRWIAGLAESARVLDPKNPRIRDLWLDSLIWKAVGFRPEFAYAYSRAVPPTTWNRMKLMVEQDANASFRQFAESARTLATVYATEGGATTELAKAINLFGMQMAFLQAAGLEAPVRELRRELAGRLAPLVWKRLEGPIREDDFTFELLLRWLSRAPLWNADSMALSGHYLKLLQIPPERFQLTGSETPMYPVMVMRSYPLISGEEFAFEVDGGSPYGTWALDGKELPDSEVSRLKDQLATTLARLPHPDNPMLVLWYRIHSGKPVTDAEIRGVLLPRWAGFMAGNSGAMYAAQILQSYADKYPDQARLLALQIFPLMMNQFRQSTHSSRYKMLNHVYGALSSVLTDSDRSQIAKMVAQGRSADTENRLGEFLQRLGVADSGGSSMLPNAPTVANAPVRTPGGSSNFKGFKTVKLSSPGNLLDSNGSEGWGLSADGRQWWAVERPSGTILGIDLTDGRVERIKPPVGESAPDRTTLAAAKPLAASKEWLVLAAPEKEVPWRLLVLDRKTNQWKRIPTLPQIYGKGLIVGNRLVATIGEDGPGQMGLMVVELPTAEAWYAWANAESGLSATAANAPEKNSSMRSEILPDGEAVSVGFERRSGSAAHYRLDLQNRAWSSVPSPARSIPFRPSISALNGNNDGSSGIGYLTWMDDQTGERAMFRLPEERYCYRILGYGPDGLIGKLQDSPPDTYFLASKAELDAYARTTGASGLYRPNVKPPAGNWVIGLKLANLPPAFYFLQPSGAQIVPADGATWELLDWSPTAQTLLLARFDDFTIHTFDLKSRELKSVGTQVQVIPAGKATLAPDGTACAAIGPKEMVVSDIASGKPASWKYSSQDAALQPLLSNGKIDSVTWMPDSSAAVVCIRSDEGSGLAWVDRLGQTTRFVRIDGGKDLRGPEVAPDGSQIALGGDKGEVCLVGMDGKIHQTFTVPSYRDDGGKSKSWNPFIAWSKDGAKLAFAYPQDAAGGFYMVKSLSNSAVDHFVAGNPVFHLDWMDGSNEILWGASRSVRREFPWRNVQLARYSITELATQKTTLLSDDRSGIYCWIAFPSAAK